MKTFLIFFLLLFPILAFSQGKMPIEDLYQELSPSDRITKRMELIENIRTGKEKNYRLSETTVLYALNLKDDPKHAASWYEWIQSTLAAGKVGQMNYSPDSLKKSEGMLKLALKKNPSHLGLQLIKLKMQTAKGLEDFKIKSELEKFKQKSANIDFNDLYFMAQLYMKVNDPNGASDMFKAMEEKAVTPEKMSMCLMGRGQNAKNAGNWNDCVDAYKKSDAVFPKNQFILLSIVQCLTGARKFAEALSYEDQLQPGGEVNCILADAQIGRGVELTNSSSFKEAEALLLKSQKCLKWESYHELTNLKLKQKLFGEAYDMMMLSAGIRSPEGKSAYLRDWSPSFKEDKTVFKRILGNIIESAKAPETKIQSHYELSKYLYEQKDPAAKDAAGRAIKEATENIKANENNYEFLKYLSAILAMEAVHLKSQLFYEQGRMVIAKLRQMNPGNDPFVQEQQSILEGASIEPAAAAIATPVPEKAAQPAPVTVAPSVTAPVKPVAPQKPAAPAPAYNPPAPIESAPAQQINSQPAGTAPIPVQ
ncbi:MAG: hypothetical protein V4598_04695 [Bdellovibrionota bacterium]